jgi:murein L,D-transpeptidase YcbB/YkuD
MDRKLLIFIKKMISLLSIVLYCLIILVRYPAYGNESLTTYYSGAFDKDQFEIYLTKGSLKDDYMVKFYAKRYFKPFWYGELENTQNLLEAIEKSLFHGLPKSKYSFLNKINSLTAVEFEIAAMRSFLVLISDLSSGILEPTEVDKSISVYPTEISNKEIYEKLSSKENGNLNVMKFIYSVAPKDLEYNKLRDELNRLR